MTDELKERVARAIAASEGFETIEPTDEWQDEWHMYAEAALAALKPGDVWEDWRITKNADVNAAVLKVLSAFSGLGDEIKKLDSLEPVARQAAEEMRERCAQLAQSWPEIVSDEYPECRPTHGEEIAAALRALEVSDE